MRQIIRRTFVTTCLLIVGGLIWAGIYTRKQGFTHTWREALESELATQGYFVDIGKLTLGAFRGLVAEDVKFYNGPQRIELVAEINDIYLDVGLERVLEKKVTINTLDIKDGRMVIPLNQDDVELGTKLQVSDLSGRIALTESHVEIVRVRANLSGIDVSVKGSLLRPPNQPNRIDDAGREALAATIAKVRHLKRFIDALEKFDFPDGPPSMRIDLRGDLRDFNSITASLEISAGQFKKRGSSYGLQSLEVFAEIDRRNGRVKVPQFEVQDEFGLLDAEGVWERENNSIHYSISSSADVVNILEFFFPHRSWGEVVFFQPPSFKAEGAVKLDQLNRPRDSRVYFPGHVLGEFQTDRFVTSGVVFSGISGTFSVQEDRFYVRNLRADHKTGVGFLNCKYEPGNGRDSLLFQSEVKMDPRIFSPFLREKSTQKFLSNWNFSDSSGVYLAASGKSSTLELNDLQAKGVIDLRNFQLNGIPFLELETDFEIENDERWYRNVLLSRRDGKITADLAYTDTRSRKWEIQGGESTVDLVEGFGAFSPFLQEVLRPYQFSSPPNLKIQGIVDGRDSVELGDSVRETDLRIELTSQGAVTFPWMDRQVQIDSPRGILHFEGDQVHLNSLKAMIGGGTLQLDFDTSIADSQERDRPFDASLQISEVGIQALGQTFDWPNQAVGGIDGEVHLSGSRFDLGAISGHGKISIENSDLIEIKGFRELKGVMEERGFQWGLTTDRSEARFGIMNGEVTTSSLSLLKDSANLTGKLMLDLQQQSVGGVLNPVDTNAQMQFHCEGTLTSPRWRVESVP